MKIHVRTVSAERNIKPGDVAVCEKGIYILVETTREVWPFTFIDLDTFRSANSFTDLETINKSLKVCGASGPILEIIKSDNLEIRTIDSKR